MSIIIRLTIMAWFALQSPIAWPESYIPKDDAEVLERLPIATGERKQLRALRSQVNENPGNYRLALNLARDYIALGRFNSDPRYYGYAEAVLTPWLKSTNEHPDALVLRATILQNRHDFQSALADLNSALTRNPRLPQAWLTLAAIYEVQGNYPAALDSCLALARFSNSLTASVCINSALSLSGQAQFSYEQLVGVVSNANGDPEELTWAYTLLGELAERLNLMKEAEGWYQKAIGQDQRSVYLLTTYADFLLDHNRTDEVIELLQGETRADPLLLRLTLAEQRSQHKDFIQHAGLIEKKMAASKDRGDTVHQVDEARFTLNVLKDSEAALRLAINNWDVQKEPRDARILLESALAAKQLDSAFSVVKFIEKSRLQDARLEPLLKLVKG